MINLADEHDWLFLRETALTPRYSSGFTTTQAHRDEFIAGATLLRVTGEWARPGHEVKPQQLAVVDALAAGHARNALGMPRRSAKTTTLTALALGRAEKRDDYRVGILTLTSGKAGRARFLKDVAPALERIGQTYGEKRNTWPFIIGRSAGQEHVEFRNSGGMVSWLSSIDDLRGEAFDLIILDEAQAADPEKVADVIAAALPTLDTRPGAQIIVAGTAGKWRVGNLLHEWLEHGRAGEWGILEYSAPPDTLIDDEHTWEDVLPIVLESHPGVGTLTTIEAIRGNWQALKRDQFAQEYLGLWGNLGEGSGVIFPQRWQDAGVGNPALTGPSLLDDLGGPWTPDDDQPAVPERFAMAAAPHFDQRSAAIVAAWRDDTGRACGYVLDHRRGVTWLADALASKARQHNTPIIYDSASGPMRVEVEAMQRMTPRPRLEPQNTNEVITAAALLIKEVNTGNARHWHQPALDAAARTAVRRPVGPGRWALGRGKDPEADICALEAWAMALRYYDDNPQHAMIAPVVAA